MTKRCWITELYVKEFIVKQLKKQDEYSNTKKKKTRVDFLQIN